MGWRFFFYLENHFLSLKIYPSRPQWRAGVGVEVGGEEELFVIGVGASSPVPAQSNSPSAPSSGIRLICAAMMGENLYKLSVSSLLDAREMDIVFD